MSSQRACWSLYPPRKMRKPSDRRRTIAAATTVPAELDTAQYSANMSTSTIRHLVQPRQLVGHISSPPCSMLASRTVAEDAQLSLHRLKNSPSPLAFGDLQEGVPFSKCLSLYLCAKARLLLISIQYCTHICRDTLSASTNSGIRAEIQKVQVNL